MFSKFFSQQRKEAAPLSSVEVLGAPVPAAPVPGLPRALTAAEEHRFRELVARHLRTSGLAGGVIDSVLDGREPLTLDLDGLRRRLVLTLPREWEWIVAEHLAARIEASAGPEARLAPEELGGFERVSPYLAAAPRLLSSLSGGRLPAGGVVLREDFTGLPTVLLRRTSSGLVPVSRQHFERWRVRPSVAFRAALGNVARTRRNLTWTPRTLDDGTIAWCLATDDGLASAQAYFLTRLGGARGRAGSMILLDGERSILVAPLGALAARESIARSLRAVALPLCPGARSLCSGARSLSSVGAAGHAGGGSAPPDRHWVYHWDGGHFNAVGPDA